jgi:hypothetical protein
MGRRDKRRREERKATPREVGGGAARVEAHISSVIAAASPDAFGPRIDAAIFYAGGLLVAAFYLVLKAYSLNAYAGDEHIYLYQAKLIADGFAPYRDFFMAHPPVQALLTAAIFKVAGYHFLLGRLLPILVTLAGGVGLAFLARREIGAVAAVAAMAISLLAYEPLRSSSHYTGLETAVALLVFAWLAARRDRMVLAAALAVAAVMTRLYAIPGVAALVIVALLGNFRRGLVLAGAGAAIGVAAFVALGLWTGYGAMFHDVFLYHAEKTAMEAGELANMKASVLFHNAVPAALFTLSLPAILFGLAASWKRAGGEASIVSRLRQAVSRSGAALPLAGVFTAVLVLALLLNMDRVWMYYFVPAFPFGALAGGYLLSQWLRGFARLARSRFRVADAHLTRGAVWGALILFAAFALSAALGHRLERNLDYFERESSKPAENHAYTWRDAAVLPEVVNRAVRALLWSDERVIGAPTSSFTFYLWHESRVFDIAADAVSEIRARTRPGDEIFGDSGTVPLLALLSGREIAGREVDTNVQRYRSGNSDAGDLVRRIDAPSTRVVFLRNRFGVSGLTEIRDLVRREYVPARSFRTSEGTSFQMFVRGAAAGAGR